MSLVCTMLPMSFTSNCRLADRAVGVCVLTINAEEAALCAPGLNEAWAIPTEHLVPMPCGTAPKPSTDYFPRQTSKKY